MGEGAGLAFGWEMRCVWFVVVLVVVCLYVGEILLLLGWKQSSNLYRTADGSDRYGWV